MKKYNVEYCLEFGGCLSILANSQGEAAEIVMKMDRDDLTDLARILPPL